MSSLNEKRRYANRPVTASTLGAPLFGGRIDYAKILVLGTAYSAAIIGAQWVAYLIRFEFRPPADMQTLFWKSLQWTLPLELVFLFVFGQFRSLLSYFSLPDAQRIVYACGATSLVTLAVWYKTGGIYAPPRSIIALGFVLDTGALVGVRVLIRKLRERQRGNGKPIRAPRRVAIIGAGDVGANLIKELISRPDLGMTPVALFDDDQAKWGKRLHGIPVVGRPEMLTEVDHGVDAAIFAMPSASGRRVREVVQVLNEAQMPFETVPSIEQMVNGSVQVSQIRPVEIEDLLGREQVELDATSIRRFVENKVVMVTGAGGSIGSELCRQIARLNPQRLLLVEQSEVSLFQIEQEMNEMGMGAIVMPLVANILDGVRMNDIFSRLHPQVVFHAAAHKHVYMMERQPSEAVRNNSVGTRLLGEMAAAFKAEAFVLISTDKAINPTNVMGASKRLAEIHLQALQARQQKPVVAAASAGANEGRRSMQHESSDSMQTHALTQIVRLPMVARAAVGEESTKFMAVRFGNVLGSSGSVVPIFKKQIAAGGPVTVTHPDVTRYFMTIPEAVGLVMQAAVMGKGGEIFVLDMGQPVKIADLARQMIELSGFTVGDDIEIKFTGLKPGEKLYEELQHHDEQHLPTDHPRIMRFVPTGDASVASAKAIDQLEPILYAVSANPIKEQIKNIIPEYSPYLE